MLAHSPIFFAASILRAFFRYTQTLVNKTHYSPASVWPGSLSCSQPNKAQSEEKK